MYKFFFAYTIWIFFYFFKHIKLESIYIIS